MKKYKFYVPVLFENGNVTKLNVNKIKELKNIVPDKDVIDEFLGDQKMMMEKGHGFHSMKIMVDQDKFIELRGKVKEISKAKNYDCKAIDLVIDKIPVIQIVSKQ